MYLRRQRLLAFFSLCFVFGAVVWMSGVESPRTTAQLAQAGAPQTGAGSGGNKEVLCGPGQLFRVIVEAEKRGGIGSDSTARAKVRTESVNNRFPKYVCAETVEADGQESCQVWRCCNPNGQCENQCRPVKYENGFFGEARTFGELAKVCKEDFCKARPSDPDCWKPVPTTVGPIGVNPAALLAQIERVSSARVAKGTNKGCGGNCPWETVAAAAAAAAANGANGAGGTNTYTPGQEYGGGRSPVVDPILTGPPGESTVVKPPPGGSTAVTNPGGDGTSAGGTAGNTSGGTSNVSKPTTFTPSSGVSDPVNFGGINFGGGGGSPSTGSGQGGGYSGGTFAYGVPVAPYMPPQPLVYLNTRGFDSVGSQGTFPESHITAYDLIARLAADTPSNGAPGTSETFAGGSVVRGIGDTLRAVGNALLRPLGSLFGLVDSPSSAGRGRISFGEG